MSPFLKTGDNFVTFNFSGKHSSLKLLLIQTVNSFMIHGLIFLIILLEIPSGPSEILLDILLIDFKTSSSVTVWISNLSMVCLLFERG